MDTVGYAACDNSLPATNLLPPPLFLPFFAPEPATEEDAHVFQEGGYDQPG